MTLKLNQNFGTMSERQQRQAMSGMIAVVVIIGITIALGALLLTFGSEFIETALVIEPIRVDNLGIKNSGDNSYLYVTVTNTGSSDITNVNATVTYKGDVSSVIAVTPATTSTQPTPFQILSGGEIISQTKLIEDATSTKTSTVKMYIPYGQEALVQITAKRDGNIIAGEPVIIRVSKN